MSSRIKTEDTTRQKLRRQKESGNTTPLARIQDIAGLRVDGTFTLEGQDLVVDRIRSALLEVGATEVRVKDIREAPHSGYRGVHLHVMSPSARLEVQVRTKLQSHWANLYEVVSDMLGRDIRYSEDAEGKKGAILRELWKQSDESYAVEKAWMSMISLDAQSSALETEDALDATDRDKISRLQASLTEQLTMQSKYFIAARGSMEELRDHHATLGEP
nr:MULTISPECIES: RelA/SpoT domain-containing protein [unclassified Corynebacterium]